jgi:hypothetical protein
MNQQCGLVQPAGALKKQKQPAAQKCKRIKVFDPKYSSTIAAYSEGISDE